ncbi:hypothetical protein [Chryseobacterium vrystaatense]|uniref:hypothetical protein n=1 Tax=Chryseobacterium vrystaatense TaxID=307480 RepID=UPI001038C014|nr:hypothetical protein [Chryseobacterium vrystaatense]
MKVTVYIIYIIIFTFCYYYLNRKLGNKGIFILYPMLFVAVVFALKFWFQYAKLQYGDNMAGSWLKIGLMTLGCFCLFTIVYGLVNFMVNTQVNCHQNYGRPGTIPIKSFLAGTSSIKGVLHFFFYTGGIILPGIAIFK